MKKTILILPDISVLQSINPPHCENIASLKKSIEVRKTRPKLETPFKVYLYCTKGGFYGLQSKSNPALKTNASGKVIGEYICDKIEPKYCANGIATYYENEQGTCLSDAELQKYADGVKPLYFWHISDLKIYDKPKELSEFFVMDKKFLKECPYRLRVYNNPEHTNGALLKGSYVCNNSFEPDFCRGQCGGATKPLTRPPQSWCYVQRLRSL